MGVRKLHTFITENCDELVETVDLVQKAKEFTKKMKILIDFNNYDDFFNSWVFDSLSETTKKPLPKTWWR